MSTEYSFCIQTDLLINHESLCISSQRNSLCCKLQTANYKLQTPLYGYIKNVILSAFLNKTPNLSSFYNFSIDKRPVKGYHVFNTKTKMQ